ncbi:hypothetical protein Ancab_012422 [Ancistrocladus abbreviatus]
MTHYEPYYLHQAQAQDPYSNNYALLIKEQPPHQQQANTNINTLFVSGLPDDVKPREIHNLFRRRPGFDSCQLKYTGRGNQVVAFVTFFNHQSAVAALRALDGVKFDPQAGSVLHIELARSNSRRKRKPGSGAYVVIDKRRKATDDAQETSSDDGDDENDNTENPDSANDDKSGEQTADPANAAANDKVEKTVEGDVVPCSTLFIANLGPNCTEEELKQALRQYPGFNVMKMRARGGMPVAFADFEDVGQATSAMTALQGCTLPSSDRGGLHIEYARSKMRKS